MARNTRVFAAIAALSLVVASCGGNSDSFSLVKEGTLTVCSELPYPPMEFKAEDGTYTGFDLDLMRAIADLNDLELAVSEQAFDGIWLAPAAGKCDVVASSVTIDEDRSQVADFTDSYFESSQSLLVRNEDKDTLNSLESLTGKKVGVQTGTSGATFIKENAPEAQIQEFPEASALYLALESGQIDAVVQDFQSNAWRAVQQGGTTVSFKNPETEQFGFAVEKGNVELLKLLNAGLAELRAGDGYDTIYAKYFGKD
jgi:polar amino acid transport system substrate-binding protein